MEAQNKAILAHLQQGNSITPLEALKSFNCLRLSARIYDLKKMGHKIVCQRITTPSGKVVGSYCLKKWGVV